MSAKGGLSSAFWRERGEREGRDRGEERGEVGKERDGREKGEERDGGERR